jgi:hypothetical protein
MNAITTPATPNPNAQPKKLFAWPGIHPSVFPREAKTITAIPPVTPAQNKDTYKFVRFHFLTAASTKMIASWYIVIMMEAV